MNPRLPGTTNRKAFTLIEMIIGMIMGIVVVAAVFTLLNFASRQITVYAERYNMYLQINNALADIQRRCVIAIAIAPDSVFSANQETEMKTEFAFESESTINAVTPDTRTDNALYRYCIDTGGNLILRKSDGPMSTVVSSTGRQSIDFTLVEGKFKPRIYFRRKFEAETENEPDFLVVTISAESTGKKAVPGLPKKIAKIDGFRLWFTDVVK